jgi:hypothetical protein
MGNSRLTTLNSEQLHNLGPEGLHQSLIFIDSVPEAIDMG